MSGKSIEKKIEQQAAIVWFRNDLRLADNPVLNAATGAAVLPVFILEPEETSQWSPGGASRWWLHQSLVRLQQSLQTRGSNLLLRNGIASAELLSLVDETDARYVFWNRFYEPESIARDSALKTALQQRGVAVESCNGSLLFEPWEIRTGDGKPFKVFTPFWRACPAASPPAKPTKAPVEIPSLASWPKSLALSKLKLDPEIDWAAGMRETALAVFKTLRRREAE